MNEISNKSLVYVILLTLTISIFSTFVSLNKIETINSDISVITGKATSSQSGTATINLSANVGIILNNNALDWGTGSANQTNPACEIVRLTTNGTTNATWLNTNNCWTGGQAVAEADDFLVENTGTLPVLLEINSSNSTVFWGFGSGTTTDYQWRALETENGACSGDLNNTWQEFDGDWQTACTVLNYVEGSDELYIELNISYNRTEATNGVKLATVQFQAVNNTG